jgi:cephalosporin hydroxylase
VSNSETSPRIEIPPGVTPERVEAASREFATVFHDLKEQTFATTTWLGVPLVKTPLDMVVLQQIIAETRPELIVETGVYVGGSAMLFASVLEMLGIDGKVIAVDVDLSFVHDKVREHPRIELLEGSSTDPEIVSHIRATAKGKRTMVDLDSDHRAHHVLEELRTYADLVSPNCYLVVEDSWFGGRPVREDAIPGPSEAIDAWLAEEQPFEQDRWRERYLLTQNPRGYMRRVPEDGAPPPGRERPDNFLIGNFELAGTEGTAPAGSIDTETIADELEAAAGEPDREVEALRKTVGNLARGTRQAAVESDMDQRRAEITTENLLREINTQRELLEERNRQLALTRANLRRVSESLPYRAWMKVRRLPGIRQVAERRTLHRETASQGKREHRDKVRAERSERFVNHHRGQ